MRTFFFACVCVLWAGALAGQTPIPSKEPPTSTLEGRVVKDPGGIPVKKAEVQLIAEAQEEGANYAATTDADGHFKIEGIHAGRYRAFVERTGLVEIDKRHRRSPGTALSFTAGKDISDVVMRMLPAAIVVGRVLDQDGDPMAQTDVSVLRYGFTLGSRHLETAASGTTNDLGEYRIPDLLPGRYLIAVNPTPDFSNLAGVETAKDPVAKQETAYITTYYPGTTDRSQAAFLDLRAGDETPVDFNLVPGPTFHVRGSIANLGAHGGANAVLMLRAKDLNAIFTAAQVDKDGKFEISHVAPGSYTLMAVVDDAGTHQITSQPLEVTDRDVNDVRVIPIAGSQVRGQLRAESNRAMDFSSLLVILRSSDGETENVFVGGEDAQPTVARVKRDGTFELKNVPAGNYSVVVEGGTRTLDFFLKSVTVGGTDVTNSGLSVGGGGTYSLDLLIGVGTGKVDGSVVDSDDRPVADAVVIAVPQGDHRGRLDLYAKGVTDQRGRFLLSGLTPGDYAIFAFESLEEGEYYDSAFLKPYAGHSENVHLDQHGRKSLQLKVIASNSDGQE
jgi:hypothetical protein